MPNPTDNFAFKTISYLVCVIPSGSARRGEFILTARLCGSSFPLRSKSGAKYGAKEGNVVQEYGGIPFAKNSVTHFLPLGLQPTDVRQ